MFDDIEEDLGRYVHPARVTPTGEHHVTGVQSHEITLNEAIERLYAHDELAADGLREMSIQLEDDMAWEEDERVVNRRRNELLTDAITILGAYEDVTRSGVGG